MSLNDLLFGPLDSEFCLYFYLLSVISYVLMVFVILALCYSVSMGSKKMDSKMIYTSLLGAAVYGVMYFQNRLLHSMCMKSEGFHALNHPGENKKNHM
jgi:hypothetical protein